MYGIKHTLEPDIFRVQGNILLGVTGVILTIPDLWAIVVSAQSTRLVSIVFAVAFVVLLFVLIRKGSLISLIFVIFGQEIVLETKTFDPTDVFRGDYVSISLAISDIPKSKVTLPIDKVIGKTLYVSLKQEGKYYVVDQVSEARPKQGVYLKGKFQEIYNEVNATDKFNVDYSLDKYFVKLGSGVALQQESYRGGLVGTVKVLGGYGVVTGLIPRRS